MFRTAAVIFVCAMLATAESSAFQHVHADADHAHAEHQHGVAAHGHAVPAPRVVVHIADHDDHPGLDAAAVGVRLEGCEPDAHVVSIASTFVAPRPEHGMAFVTIDLVVAPPPARAWSRLSRPRVRVHGPPRITDAPLRAPPVFDLD